MKMETWSYVVLPTGGSLQSQVEYHVWDKFATPILYGINNFENNDIFYTYT
jgi:hypothetical protein